MSNAPLSDDPGAQDSPKARGGALQPAAPPARSGAGFSASTEGVAGHDIAEPAAEQAANQQRGPTTFYEVVWLAIDRLCELIDKVLLLKEAQPFLRLFAVLALIGLVVVLIIGL